MSRQDPFDLERFVDAQGPVWDQVCRELAAGRKRTHWIWYIFPQMRGLGRSATADTYGIASLDEAAAYLAHPLLGPRLMQATEAMLRIEGKTLSEIMASPDDLKFVSSMTLFAEVPGVPPLFRQALAKFAAGHADARTLALLGRSA